MNDCTRVCTIFTIHHTPHTLTCHVSSYTLIRYKFTCLMSALEKRLTSLSLRAIGQTSRSPPPPGLQTAVLILINDIHSWILCCKMEGRHLTTSAFSTNRDKECLHLDFLGGSFGIRKYSAFDTLTWIGGYFFCVRSFDDLGFGVNVCTLQFQKLTITESYAS